MHAFGTPNYFNGPYPTLNHNKGKPMLKKLSIFKAIILTAACSAFATSNYSGGMKISRLTVDGSGIMVGFSSRPADCAGNYFNWHARIPSTTPNFNQILAMVLSAKTSGDPLDIWYETPPAQLSCAEYGSLLKVYGVGFQ
jgi:hypothetical protein